MNITSTTFTRNLYSGANAVIGGGILAMNNATLNVDKSQFTDGYASIGGAIGAVNAGSVTVTRSTFNGNRGYGGGYVTGGGAIAILGKITDFPFYGAPQETDVQISSSNFVNNSMMDGGGGAISVEDADSVIIDGSTFGSPGTNGIPDSGNKAGDSYNGGLLWLPELTT